jgi:hypothetical protein
MTGHNTMTLPLGLALAASLSLTSMATPAAADRGHRWHHGGGMMGLAERYDANQDGKISQEEIDGNRTRWHGEFDTDKNGTLSLDEFEKLWLKARREQMVREFQHFDRDGNAAVTLKEYRRPMADIVRNMDRNGDGVLSRDDRRMPRPGGGQQNAQ